MPAPRPTGPRAWSLVALALTSALLVGSCSEGPSDDGAASSPALLATEAPGLPRTVDELPAIDVQDFETLLSELRGTPVVVNFWASWCDPCEDELPLLAEAARTHGDAVQFIGVDILDARDPARGMIRRIGVPYPNVFDALGAVRNSVGSLGQPVTVFYRSDGVVAAKIDGPLDGETLDRWLDELVG